MAFLIADYVSELDMLFFNEIPVIILKKMINFHKYLRDSTTQQTTCETQTMLSGPITMDKFVFLGEKPRTREELFPPKKPTPVVQCDVRTGEIIRVWTTVQAAAEYIRCHSDSIRDAVIKNVTLSGIPLARKN